MNANQLYAKAILLLYTSQKSVGQVNRQKILDILCQLDEADAEIYKEYCSVRDNLHKRSVSYHSELHRRTHDIRRSAVNLSFQIESILYSNIENAAEMAENVIYDAICDPSKYRWDR